MLLLDRTVAKICDLRCNLKEKKKKRSGPEMVRIRGEWKIKIIFLTSREKSVHKKKKICKKNWKEFEKKENGSQWNKQKRWTYHH